MAAQVARQFIHHIQSALGLAEVAQVLLYKQGEIQLGRADSQGAHVKKRLKELTSPVFCCKNGAEQWFQAEDVGWLEARIMSWKKRVKK